MNYSKNIIRYFIMSLWNHFFCYIPSFRIRYNVLKYFYRAKLGKVSVHRGVKFFSPWRLTVGDNCNIQYGSFIDCRGGVVVGNNVDITLGVKIISQYHDINSPNYKTISGQVNVEDYVILSSFSTVLPGVTVSFGSVLGASSVLTKSTKSNSLYAGCPAVFKRDRIAEYTYNPYYERPFH